MFSIVLLLSGILFLNAESVFTATREATEVPFYTTRVEQIYFVGKSYLLRPWEKRYFSALNILHLFTPSGLHFTSLLIPIRFLIRKSVKRARLAWILKILIILPFCFLQNFHSLRRVAIFGILILLKKPGTTLPKELIHFFFATFFIDFLNGSYSRSPLSFTYSFLFWGSIITAIESSKLKALKQLGVAQIFMCYLLEQSFWPMGYLLGQMITIIYSFIFPIILLLETFFKGGELLTTIHQMLYAIAKWQYSLPSLNIITPILVGVLSKRRSLFLFSVLFYTSVCPNHFKGGQDPNTSYFFHQRFLKNKKILNVARKRKKLLLTTEDGLLCQAQLKNSSWLLKCKQ